MGWIRYGLPGLVLGLVLTLVLEGRGPSVRAQSSPAIPLPVAASERPHGTNPAPAGGEATGTIAFTSPAGNNGQLLTLIDTRTRSFAVYRIDPTNPKGTVKLEAVRQYQWDLKLAEYNNLPPEVAAIESTVKSLGQPNR